jgi:glycosyltransferase involved in cell wall biosynthesis
VKRLRDLDCSVVLVPVYTPITVEGENCSDNALLYGGISVYLEQKFPPFRYLPGFMTKWLDRPGLVSSLTKKRKIEIEAENLGELTLSILRGEKGNQRQSLKRAVKWIKKESKPDIINLTNLLIAGFVPSMKRELNSPVIVTLQGDDLFLDELTESHRSLVISELRRLASHIDGFITFSQFYAKKMADLLEVPEEKFHLVNLGVDTDEFNNFTRHPIKDPTIGYFGRLAPEKGFHNIVDAFIEIHQKYNLNNARLCAGGWLSPADQNFFNQQVEKLKSANLINFFDHAGSPDLDKKKDFFGKIDVFSLPTIHEEPKGLSVLEAQACGIPVVQPDHGIFPEILAKTKGGILYDPMDSKSLAKEIVRLLKDKDHANQLGEVGRKNTFELFSAKKMAKETLQVYHQFTGS